MVGFQGYLLYDRPPGSLVQATLQRPKRLNKEEKEKKKKSVSCFLVGCSPTTSTDVEGRWGDYQEEGVFTRVFCPCFVEMRFAWCNLPYYCSCISKVNLQPWSRVETPCIVLAISNFLPCLVYNPPPLLPLIAPPFFFCDFFCFVLLLFRRSSKMSDFDL